MNELTGENNWYNISEYRDLTYQQLEEFRDKLNWTIISRKYKMNYEFIKRNNIW